MQIKICGFPLGIKVVNDLLTKNEIKKSEANYLASFCNNLSLAFYINILLIDLLKIDSIGKKPYGQIL